MVHMLPSKSELPTAPVPVPLRPFSEQENTTSSRSAAPTVHAIEFQFLMDGHSPLSGAPACYVLDLGKKASVGVIVIEYVLSMTLPTSFESTAHIDASTRMAAKYEEKIIASAYTRKCGSPGAKHITTGL